MRENPLGKFLVVTLLALVVTALAGCGSQKAGLQVGDRAPDFTLPAAEGGSFSLGDTLGVRPALLYFHMAMG